MPRARENDPVYSLRIYARFSGQVFLAKDCNRKKDRCAFFECNNDRVFPEKYSVKFFFCPKLSRKY